MNSSFTFLNIVTVCKVYSLSESIFLHVINCKQCALRQSLEVTYEELLGTTIDVNLSYLSFHSRTRLL